MRRVARALPVREIPIEDGSINVEMDPEDNFRAVESLSSDKLKCVPHLILTEDYPDCCPSVQASCAAFPGMLALWHVMLLYKHFAAESCMVGSQN